MKLPKVILTKIPETGQQILIATTYPFIIGKIVLIKNQDDAEDYDKKQVNHVIKRITGYNIFINFAGNMGDKIPATESYIFKAMNEMEEYYRTDILRNSYGINKNYKIKTDTSLYNQ